MASKKLSAVTIRRLRRVKHAILAEPGLYDQSQPELRRGNADCGTPGCILGWANALLPSPTRRQLRQARASVKVVDPFYLSGGRLSGVDLALVRGTARLHMDGEQSFRLWLISRWPDRFCTTGRYQVAGNTAEERAETAARRIEHFIKTNGNE